MPKTVKVTAQVEPELKKLAEARFKEWGMTVDEAITMFYDRVAGRYCSDPFSPHIPNAETIAAMEEGENREGLPKYSSFGEFLASLTNHGCPNIDAVSTRRQAFETAWQGHR